MNWQPPRGTRDMMPKDTALMNSLFSQFRDILASYGYGQVETPAFESFDLLSKKSGPEIEDEIYVFEDKGGRKLGLRFDYTVPIARMVASDRSLPKPIKWYYIGRMWRYDRPQAGRYREFWQAGVELIGPKEGVADAEMLSIVSSMLTAAGIDNFYFKVNSRKLIENIVVECGIDSENVPDILRSIDKLDKIGKESVIRELSEKGIAPESVAKLFSSIENDYRPDDTLKGIISMANVMGVDNIKLSPYITRGLDYYTGFVFETFIEGKEDIGSVCSGGRYDNLISSYGGEDLPAVGFGLGVDRLICCLPDDYTVSSPDVFIISVNDDMRKEVAAMTTILRKYGIRTEMDMLGKDFGKQMTAASSLGSRNVIVVGPAELESLEFTIKNMSTGEERKAKLQDIPEALKD